MRRTSNDKRLHDARVTMNMVRRHRTMNIHEEAEVALALAGVFGLPGFQHVVDYILEPFTKDQ